MRNIQFIIFFSTVITIYGLLSFYIYSKGVQVFPQGTPARLYYKIIFIFLSVSYIIARVLERVWLSSVSDIFTWIGSFWLAAFFYLLLIVIAIDLVRLVNYITKAIYEVSWGYKKKGNTHVYVSSGVGGWGPPVRIGNRPEIALINIVFDEVKIL